MLQRAARLLVPGQFTSLTSIATGSRAFATTHLGTSSPSPTKLDDVLKLDTLVNKSAAEIEQIWMQVRLCNLCQSGCNLILVLSRNRQDDLQIMDMLQ